MAFGRKKSKKKQQTEQQNPYSVNNADMSHNPFYPETTENQWKEILMAIGTSIVCLALVAVIVANFSLYLTQSSYANTNSSSLETSESTDTDSSSSSDASSQSAFAYTDNDSVNLSQCLTTDAYATITSEDSSYSFGYPKYMFNSSNLDQGVYTFAYTENGNTDYQLKVYKEDNSGNAVDNANRLYNHYVSSFYGTYFHMVSDSTDSSGMARALLAGYTNTQKTEGTYIIAANDGSQNYILEFDYYDSDYNDTYKEINYVVDCVYRYCSFSGTTYQPRTYSQFQADDMGEKK